MKKTLWALMLALISAAVLLVTSSQVVALTVEQQKAGPLGDLSNYIGITRDTLKIVKSGDLKGGKARINDLESAWDAAEAKQKVMSPSDWEIADQALDRALAKLRSNKPDKEACISSLESLLSTLQRLSKAK